MEQAAPLAADKADVTRIQDRAIAEARGHARPGGAVLTVAPTGAGKTRINSVNLANFADDFRRTHGRDPVIVVLQHRHKLASQGQEALSKWVPDSGLTTSMSLDGKLDQSGTVNYAGVATIAANLASLKPADLVCIDEAHHASDSENADYTKVINRYAELNPDMVLFATTATPGRPDGRGLHPKLKDAPRVTIGYKELERAGQIKLPRTHAVNIRLEAGGTMNSLMRDKYKPEKDADASGLNKAIRLARPADYNEQMLDQWERGFRTQTERQGVRLGTLVFESTIASASRFAAEAAARGISVKVMDSDQSREHNDAALAAYAAGKLDMIVSIKMIDEGVDVPLTRCVMINRETTSEIEYQQMVGRAMRSGDTPELQAFSPVVYDGGASTMIHGAVERRAEIIDYFQRLERGEIVPERNEDAKYMPNAEGYNPWRVLKDPPPVMAITDGKRDLYAVASRTPDGSARYSLAEAQVVRGKPQMTLLRDANGKPLVAIDAKRLIEIEKERLLPARHNLLRMETTSSAKITGKSLVDERLLDDGHIQSALAFARAMGGHGR